MARGANNMMHSISFRLVLAAFGACLLVPAGCSRTQQSRFYLLTSVPEVAPEAAREEGSLIGVRSVQLPEYLDRPQIVSVVGANQFRIAEFDRWAEPLATNFAAVLAENLSMLLPTNHVVISPWGTDPAVNFQVVVNVTQFHGQLNGKASLTARWALLGGDGAAILRRRSTLSESATAEGYAALVAAQNRLVTSLSREIVEAINTSSRHARGN